LQAESAQEYEGALPSWALSWLQGKTQLVKGRLRTLSEDQSALTISFNHFTDVASFQKVGPAAHASCACVPSTAEKTVSC
jgi:hypothetical protein